MTRNTFIFTTVGRRVDFARQLPRWEVYTDSWHDPRARRALPHRRRGAVILVVMIALMIITTIGATLLKMAVAESRLALREQWRLQADWLAEAGLERAAANLATNGDYTGESWKIAADDLDGTRAGVVLIEVAAAEGEPNRRAVTVRADYPSGTDQRARVTKRVAMRITTQSR
jgi:Tfp pilus assembly protein PilX